MKVARVLHKPTARARAAIERDGALYDVELLERALERAGIGGWERVGELGDRSDFHARVATLRCAGLYDIDSLLIRGQRPTSARLHDDETMWLAPCDTERAAIAIVDVSELRTRGTPSCRFMPARNLAGQDALVPMHEDELAPDVWVGVAVIIGDDLERVTAAQARRSIVGYSLFVEWIAPSLAHRDPDLLAQLGPALTSLFAVPKVSAAGLTITSAGRAFEGGSLGELPVRIDEAIAFASRTLALHSGDVVAIGPLPGGSLASHGAATSLHQPIEVAVEGLGVLRGVPVPRVPPPDWRR